ncbi:receptor-type tyrosine-protein phosphatase beta-like [Lethenteron reissneri]|uniref:receptor-type tyrosine-protein phosphatase beta-like n=1 Tax=Lethenteron reissneri TaxID=7753 RepID=UPI002AB68269|nr:receptor-type tyrosine-protein phosphatase beta-like [Lethenteron reissneri]
MGRLAPPSRLLSGSSQLLLLMLTLGTVARVANGCQISEVQVSARSETTITVTWTEVGVDATSYVLQLYDQSTFTYSPFTINGSASNFTFTGLVPNRYYSIAITVNCTGGSNVSSTVYDSTLPPKVNVTITGKTMTSMSFSWEVPSSSLSYNARLKDNNNINQSSYVLSTGSITFTNLIPDTNYYAYVETRNLYCSQGSDVVMDRTLPANVNVSTIAKNATTITVSWNMSSVDLFYYIASLKERQDGPNIQSQTRTTLPQSVTFTGLVPGRNYFISVTIYIPATNTISVTFTERTLPPKPTLSITANTMTNMTVSWTTLASDVDYYLVYLRETANGTLVKTNNVTSRPTKFNELVPGRNYSVSIEAHSADLSQLSDVVMSRTLPPKVYVTISFSSPSPTAMTVSWVAPISDVDYYVVYLSETYNATAMKGVILSSTITTKEFTDLIPDRSYDASVTAYSGIYYQRATIITRMTLPSYIVLTITSKTTTTMTLSMTTSLPYSFSYLANLTETVSGNLVTISPIYPTMATFTGLVPGRKYSVYVEGSNGSFSSWSYMVIVRTFPPQVNVTVIVNSPTAMTVSWVAPTSDVDYYVVYLNETYNAAAVKSFILPSTVTTQAFTDLVPGRSYNASVTVYSGINSQPSDIVTNITGKYMYCTYSDNHLGEHHRRNTF